jgi:formate dehydrogenase maturation protein FdhE
MSTEDKPESRYYIQRSARDWPEDAKDLDNGQYWCHCRQCEERFIGHKRRHICSVCSNENKTKWDAMTPEEQAVIHQQQNEEIQKWMNNREKL